MQQCCKSSFFWVFGPVDTWVNKGTNSETYELIMKKQNLSITCQLWKRVWRLEVRSSGRGLWRKWDVKVVTRSFLSPSNNIFKISLHNLNLLRRWKNSVSFKKKEVSLHNAYMNLMDGIYWKRNFPLTRWPSVGRSVIISKKSSNRSTCFSPFFVIEFRFWERERMEV